MSDFKVQFSLRFFEICTLGLAANNALDSKFWIPVHFMNAKVSLSI